MYTTIVDEVGGWPVKPPVGAQYEEYFQLGDDKIPVARLEFVILDGKRVLNKWAKISVDGGAGQVLFPYAPKVHEDRTFIPSRDLPPIHVPSIRREVTAPPTTGPVTVVTKRDDGWMTLATLLIAGIMVGLWSFWIFIKDSTSQIKQINLWYSVFK